MAVDPIIKQKADDIRHKIYGKEVRESLASGIEAMSEDVVSVTGRQATVEEQFQSVLDETTGKDVINGPEIIAARNGEANLKTRLDKEQQQVTAQLAQNASQVESIYKPQSTNKTIISWIDDDGVAAFMTKLKPLLDVRELKCTLAVTTKPIFIDKNATYLSESQLKTLQSEGFEIVSHSHTHTNFNGTDMTVIDQECKTSQDILKEKGFAGYNVLVYSLSGTYVGSVESRNKVKRYYDLGITNVSGVNRKPIDSYQMKRFLGADLSGNVTYTKGLIDDVVANGGWLILGSHTSSPDFTSADVEQILDYIVSKGMTISSINEGLSYYKNALNIGDSASKKFFLGNDGTLDTQLNTRFETNTSYTKLPKEFDKLSLTISRNYSTADATLSAQGGVLETYIFEDHYFSYQNWRPYNSKDTYFRRSTTTTGDGWTEWEQLIAKTFVNEFNKDFTRPITSFAAGAITQTGVFNDAANQPFGWTTGGTLLTFRNTAADSNFGWQIFHPYNKKELFIRYWNGSAWSNWRLATGNLSLTTTERNAIPVAQLEKGLCVFDDTLSKPVWWAGAVWKDATGTTV